jgi:hypothetical protein
LLVALRISALSTSETISKLGIGGLFLINLGYYFNLIWLGQ